MIGCSCAYACGDRRTTTLLPDTLADLAAQLDQQDALGIQVTERADVPEVGPANRGEWHSINNVTAVFGDLKASTHLNSTATAKTAARAYNYFVRAMVLILNRFDVRYVDIHGDGVFGLFSGPGSVFNAFAAVITAKTVVDGELQDRFDPYQPDDWELEAGFGMDRGRLLVRQLGLRSEKLNEVWAGKPVNIASKLSSVAKGDQLVVSPRAFDALNAASTLRKRAALWTCGCHDGLLGAGLDAGAGQTESLWTEEAAPTGLGLDFETIHRLNSHWCGTHGPEFCEAVVTGKRPRA